MEFHSNILEGMTCRHVKDSSFGACLMTSIIWLAVVWQSIIIDVRFFASFAGSEISIKPLVLRI